MNWKGDSKISDADKKGRKTGKMVFILIEITRKSLN